MKIAIPHLVVKPGKDGRTRHYWQPSALLRRAGWQPVTLGPDLESAMRQAQALNAQVATWRAGALGIRADGKTGRNPDVPATTRQDRQQVRKFVAAATVRATIRDFLEDRAPELAPATLRQYRHALTIIDRWAGDQPLRFITADRCRVLLAELAKPAGKGQPPRLHRAAGIGRVLRTLMGWAVDHERIDANPMDRVTIREPKPRHQLWPDHAIDAMVAMADAMGLPSIGTATLLAADTGQREADLLALTWAKLRTDEGTGRRTIRLQQGKTGVWIDVPLTSRLEARLTTAEATNRSRNTASIRVLTREADSRPWPQEAFIKAFATVRAATIAGSTQHGLEPCAELAGLQFRDLRRTIIVRLAEAQVDLPGIAAISGHKIEVCKKILETYLPRTSKMAAAAIEKLEAHRAKQADTKPNPKEQQA